MSRLKDLQDDKVSVQMRLGAGLLKRIDKAAWEAGISRTVWVQEAADRALLNGKPRRYRTTATELMARRTAIMIRMDTSAVGLIDEQAKERGVTRTVWLIDACLASLRNGQA